MHFGERLFVVGFKYEQEHENENESNMNWGQK